MAISSLRLVEIDVYNYRNCRKTRFRPNRNISALIGINGAGKTTILNAISLLRTIFTYGSGYKYRNKKELPPEHARLTATFAKGKDVIRFSANISFAANERNIDEIIAVTEKWNFDGIVGLKKAGWIELPSGVFVPSAARFGSSHFISDGGYVQYVTRFPMRRIPVPIMQHRAIRLGMEIAAYVVGIRYYSAAQFTNPLRAPSSFEIEEDRPYRIQESMHANFLHDLYRAWKANTAAYQQFESVVTSNGLRLVAKIEFKAHKFPTTQYEVRTGGAIVRKRSSRELIIPIFSSEGLKLSPNQLSEGILKSLALVFYTITDESRLLLIEEPEVCVHHGLLVSIVELIKDVSKEKQVIFSTHSDFILDLLDPEDVFLIHYERKNGIEATPLPRSLSQEGKAALKAYLSNEGTLGEYIKHGGLRDAH